jgi:hypothetical protein
LIMLQPLPGNRARLLLSDEPRSEADCGLIHARVAKALAHIAERLTSTSAGLGSLVSSSLASRPGGIGVVAVAHGVGARP